jgi:hypothetical protein
MQKLPLVPCFNGEDNDGACPLASGVNFSLSYNAAICF